MHPLLEVRLRQEGGPFVLPALVPEGRWKLRVSTPHTLAACSPARAAATQRRPCRWNVSKSEAGGEGWKAPCGVETLTLHGAGRPAPGQALSRAVSEVWRLPWSSLVPDLRVACG